MNQVKSFKLVNQDNREYQIPDPDTRFTILFFYPKDNTPGCSLEVKRFDELREEFKRLNCSIFGVSGLSTSSKKKFAAKLCVSINLLSDEKFEIAKLLGVYKKKKFMGKEYFGIERSTFILDKTGKILKFFNSVNPDNHASECLEFLKSIC